MYWCLFIVFYVIVLLFFYCIDGFIAVMIFIVLKLFLVLIAANSDECRPVSGSLSSCVVYKLAHSRRGEGCVFTCVGLVWFGLNPCHRVRRPPANGKPPAILLCRFSANRKRSFVICLHPLRPSGRLCISRVPEHRFLFAGLWINKSIDFMQTRVNIMLIFCSFELVSQWIDWW